MDISILSRARGECTFTTEKSVTFTAACANEIIPSINCSFVYKAKEGRHVRIRNNSFFGWLVYDV